MIWFRLLTCEYFLVFFVLCDNKLNIVGLRRKYVIPETHPGQI